MKLSPQVNSFRGLPAAATGELFDSFARRVCANVAFSDVNSGIRETAPPHQGLGRDFHRFFQTIEAPPLCYIWFLNIGFDLLEGNFPNPGGVFRKARLFFCIENPTSKFCFFFAKDGA